MMHYSQIASFAPLAPASPHAASLEGAELLAPNPAPSEFHHRGADDISGGVLLKGRCMFVDRREVACLAEISTPERMVVRVSGRAPVGSRLIAYLDGLGRVEGDIVRSSRVALHVELVATMSKRQRLARRLDWLVRQAQGQAENLRAAERHERRAGCQVMVSLNGAVLPGRIIDESSDGMALAFANRPAMGAELWVDGVRARVVRHLAEGLAVKFLRETPE